MASKRIHLIATAFTHQGALRPENQDTIAVADWIRSEPMMEPRTIERDLGQPVLALVADGMGGHAAGEVSSRVAAEYLVSQAARAIDEAAVTALLHEASAEQFALMEELPRFEGMGTTVAGIALSPGAVVVFNVGDSRVYRYDGRGLIQLSTDDTPGPKEPDGRTAVYTTPIITQTLGGCDSLDEIEPHLLSEPLRPDVRYLICSDGLTDLVDLTEIHAGVGEDDRKSVLALFEIAMARGGGDNISIILVRLHLGRETC